MTAAELLDFTKHSFRKMGRKVTDEQHQTLSAKIAALPQPLYAQLVRNDIT